MHSCQYYYRRGKKTDEVYQIMDRAMDSDGLRLAEMVCSGMKQAFREVRGLHSQRSALTGWPLQKKKNDWKGKKSQFWFCLRGSGRFMSAGNNLAHEV